MDPEPQDPLRGNEREHHVRRAAAAYLLDAKETGWPDWAESGVERHGKLNYVVLRDARGALLAAYRVRRPAGKRPAQLKRLVRLPEGL